MKRKAVIGILCAALILTLALGVLAACNVDPDTYTVTFYDAETSQVVSAVKDVEAGYVLKASDIPAAPVYSGKRFVGWFIGDSDVEVGAGYTVNRSVMATARYTDEGGAVTQYTVTFELGEYDGSGQAPAAQTVNAGSSITLPAVGVTWAGHSFTGWKANNTEYEANATYTVNGNVTFVAQWSNMTAESVLESLRGNILFEGTINEYYNDGDVMPSTIHTLYDAEQQLVEQYETFENTRYDYLLVGLGEGGLAYTPYHDFNGKVKWTLPIDSEGNPLNISFDDIANPFEKCTASDLIYNEETGNFALAPASASIVENALTGYDYEIVSFEIEVVDGKANKLVYRTASQSLNGYTFYDVAELGIVRGARLSSDYTSDYAAQPELQAALEKAAQASTYTVHYSEQNGDVKYDVYRAEDTIWFDVAEGESYGYLVRPDQNVWRFGFDGDDMTVGTSPVATSLDRVAAYFMPNYISPAMFTLSDNKYVLRDVDLEGLYGDVLLGQCALAFATGEQEQYRFINNITGLAVVLTDDGDLDKVEVRYLALSGNRLATIAATLSFDAFDATTLPEEVVLDESVINGTFAVDFIGTWIDDENGLRADISLDSVVIDGLASKIVSKTENNVYTVTIGGLTYQISKKDSKLVLNVGETSYELRHRECAWEDLLGTYRSYESEQNITLTVDANGLRLSIDGDEGQLSADNFTISEIDGTPIISFLYSSDQSGLVNAYITMLAKNKAVNFCIEDGDEGYLFYVDLYVDGYDFNAWDAFVGAYTTQGSDSLNITKESITLVYGGDTLTFSKSDIVFEEVEYGVPVFTLKNSVYTLQQYGSTADKLALYESKSETEATRKAIFVKGDYKPGSWDVYVGKFVGLENEGNGYSVRILKDALYLKMEGVEYRASAVDFDKYMYFDATGSSMWLYRFDFTANDTQYSLRQFIEGDVYILQLYQVNETNNLPVCKLERDDRAQQEDWSQFVGTYSWSDYSVEVTADELIVTLDGQAAEVSQQKFYSRSLSDSMDYIFEFVADGKEYTLQFINGQAAAILSSDDLKLILVGDEYSPETDLSAWEGYYATKDNSVKIKVTADAVSFALDNGELADAKVIYFVSGTDMVIEFGDTQYFLTFTKETVSIYKDKIDVMHNGSELGVAEKTDEPEAEGAWVKFAGTYKGSNPSSSYTVIVTGDGITLSIDRGPAKAGTSISLSYHPDSSPSWAYNELKFTVDGKEYTLEIYDDGGVYLKIPNERNADMHKE